MANEQDFYGRKKQDKGLTGTDGSDYLAGVNSSHNDFTLPDYSGKGKQTTSAVPFAGRSRPFSRQSGTGMKAVADTNEATFDPANAVSTRAFQAGHHGAVSSSIQDEHDPANAALTRLFQAGRHEVIGKTVKGQYDLENQPTSSFFKAIRGNGQSVSGLDTVAKTDKEVNNLDYDAKDPQQAHPYVNSIHQGVTNSLMNHMKTEHMGTEFEKASRYPDQYTGTSPLKAARSGFRELDKMSDEFNQEYEKNRYHYSDPTAESIHQATEKYSHVLGGLAGTSLLMAVKRTLPESGMTLAANDWSRLTHEIYGKVLDKTGDDEFAQAMGWGAMATLASDLKPWGLFSKKGPANYQTIAEPVSRVMDSIISDHLANKVADEGVDSISKNKGQKSNPGNPPTQKA